MKNIKVSIIQPEFKGWDFDKNFEKCESLIKKVLPENPDFICLPELFPGRALYHSDFLSTIKVPLFFGHSIPPKDKEKNWENAYSLNQKNGLVESQIKLKLTNEEKLNNYREGDEINVFKINNLRIGVSICHSFAFDFSNISKYLNKIDLMIVPALAPFYHIDYWKNILLTRAIDLKVPIIFINYAGQYDDHGIISGGGNSSVVLPLPKGKIELSEFVKQTNCLPNDNFLVSLGNNEDAVTLEIPLYAYKF